MDIEIEGIGIAYIEEGDYHVFLHMVENNEDGVYKQELFGSIGTDYTEAHKRFAAQYQNVRSMSLMDVLHTLDIDYRVKLAVESCNLPDLDIQS